MTTSPTCARCGEAVTAGARFCMKCGSDVSGEQGGASTAMMEPAIDENAIALELLKKATIGDYEILRELGRGGMAAVYLAHDIALDRKVAVKVMSPALLLMGEGMQERFKREARTAANLSHPNIIPIYAVKSSGKALYFVMKFIPGRSLESIIKELGPMPVPLVRALLQQVGSALGYAHRNGIIHRDVKPANIMIDEEGWTFVTDFGIAKAAENRGLTMTGIAVGTPSYMSPEQCAAKDITGKSDQYSLGVVAYEMLTGRQPFEGDSAMAIMFAHFHEAPRPLLELRPDCPPDLAAAVMRMLEKGPEKRWGSMEEALVGLAAQPLSQEDPTRLELVKVVRAKSNREILDNITPPPTSPVPPARTRAVPEAATTPIPAPPRVLSVTVAPGTAQLSVGQTIQLTATPQLSDGTAAGRSVSWTSDTPTIAMVSDTGLVTGVGVGSATISAKIDGVSGTTAVAVTPPPVAKITLAPTERRIIAGDSGALSATLLSADGKALADRSITWSSSAPSVAAVSPRGIVSGLTPGAAEISAKCEGIEAKASITVLPVPVATVTVAQPDPVLEGKELTLVAVLKDQRGTLLSGREVKWSSAAPEMATVSPAGVVKALKAGTVKLTAESEGKSWTVTLTVQAPPPSEVKTAEIPQQKPAPKIEGKPAPQVEPALPEARVPVAAIDPTPKIIPPPPVEPARKVVEKPRSSPGKLIGAVVAVLVLAGVGFALSRRGPEIPPVPVGMDSVAKPLGPAAVASIEIMGESAPVAIGHTRQLAAVVKDDKGLEVTGRVLSWRSSDNAIATVSDNGAVTGTRAGTVTITASSEGHSDEFGLTVEPALEDAPVAVASVAIDGGNQTLEVGSTAQLSARLKDGKGAALADRTVVWASDDPRIAQVSSGGEVRGIGAGQTTISASSEGKRAETRITVKAPPPPVAVTPPKGESQVRLVRQLFAGDLPLRPGTKVQYKALITTGDGKWDDERQAKWTTSAPRIATVDNSGTVTGVAPGQVVIRAELEGKASAETLTVEPELAVAVGAVILTPGSRSLKVGDIVTWLASARDGRGKELNGRPIAWSSSAPQVASVSSTGVITALTAGSTEIRVEAEGKSASASLTVTAPAVAVTPPPVTPPAAQPTASNALVPRRGTEAGGAFGCGIASGGAVCWGTGLSGLTAVGGTAGITAVSVGRAHACGLQNGRAICWGDNKQGQLGGSAGNASAEAVAVSGDLSFSSLSAGAFHTCGVSGTKVYCWGRGKEGQLGEGSGSDRKKPVQVKGGMAFSSVSAGGNHTCALTTVGKAYCWGDGFSGQLGFGGQDQQSEPIDVSGNTTYTMIAAGGKHTCAITGAGKAFCWGANDAGQLGDGSKSDRAQPQAVSGGLSFTQISAGNSQTCALAGGEAYCWGENRNGQLGDGSKNDRNKPTAVVGGLSFASISTGDGFSCGVTRGGESYCWGRNDKGQVDGTGEIRGVPTQVR